jgi:hypothetical protein
MVSTIPTAIANDIVGPALSGFILAVSVDSMGRLRQKKYLVTSYPLLQSTGDLDASFVSL